jgi:hypothetical protein
MSKVDELIAKFKQFKEELNKGVNCSYQTATTSPPTNATTGTSGGENSTYKAEAGPNPLVISTTKPLAPKHVEDKGVTTFKVNTPPHIKGAMSQRHPMGKGEIDQDMMAMSEEVIKFDKNGQWSMSKADPAVAAKGKAKAAVPAADPAAAALDPAADPAPVAAKGKAKTGASTGGDTTSPTHTNTETGGSSPGGASTGGVGSGLGGAGTGGAATGGASTGGAGTVTVTISGSSSTETSSGAGAKKGKGKGGEPAAPITLNISNVGGRTDAGNVASGDGPGASGSGGTAPNGFGGGGGGASPDEPANFSTQGKDKVVKFDNNGQWSLDKSAFKTLQHKIEHEGHSADSAAAITASIGRKEIGQKEMTARSKAGMNKAQVPGSKYPPAAEAGASVNTLVKPAKVSSGPPGYGPMNPASTAAPIASSGPYRRPTRKSNDQMGKVDPDENVNIPHPKGKAVMTNGVNKEENMKDGTNQRIANPPEAQVNSARGKVHMIKDEGTNEEAGTSRPHNKGKFKVMDEVTEKESKKAKVAGKPYNGEDKKMHKADVTSHKPTGPQGNGAKGNDENKAPGRGTFGT